MCAFADEKTAVDSAGINTAIEELGWKEHPGNTGLHHQLRALSRPASRESHVTEIEVRADGECVSVQTFPRGRIIVGRSPDNEIYIKSKFVSRHHAQLISDDDGCMIEDLNSTNGVFVADRQVKKYRLKDGDVVSLGVHELVYRDIRDSSQPESNTDEDDLREAGG